MSGSADLAYCVSTPSRFVIKFFQTLRRRRDSNSRTSCPVAAFPRRCTRPLCDSSALFIRIFQEHYLLTFGSKDEMKLASISSERTKCMLHSGAVRLLDIFFVSKQTRNYLKRSCVSVPTSESGFPSPKLTPCEPSSYETHYSNFIVATQKGTVLIRNNPIVEQLSDIVWGRRSLARSRGLLKDYKFIR